MKTTKKRHMICLTAHETKMLDALCMEMNSKINEVFHFALTRLYIEKFLENPIPNDINPPKND